MAGVELRVGARLLMGASEILSGASSKTGLATGVLTDGMRLQAATGMRSGAEAVRSMGGPFFARFADDLLSKATSVQGGGPVGPAIEASMDGASWLLRRAAHLR
jgi:hypothetical protein